MRDQSITGVLLLASLLLIGCDNSLTRRQESKLEIPEGVSVDAFVQATNEFSQQYGRSPDRMDVFSWLAESSIAKQDWQVAMACLQEIPDAHPQYGWIARFQQADVHLEFHQGEAALEQYRRFLELAPDDPRLTGYRVHAEEGIVYILGILLQFEERQPMLQTLVSQQLSDPFHTMLYCFPTVFRWNGPAAVETLDRWLEQSPNSLALRAAKAKYLASLGEVDQALALARAMLDEAPEAPAVLDAAMYVFEQAGDLESLERLATSPVVRRGGSWSAPIYRGQIALRKRDFTLAIAEFRVALELDGASAAAWTGLAQAARLTGDKQLADDATIKVQTLARIQNRLGWSGQEPDNPDPLVEIGELCRTAGLLDQARVIAQVAVRVNDKHAGAQQLLESLQVEEGKP
ncbi:MAG: tetratricopeptide repeat protein [Planctomycetaceae bacterium]|nr:tetratricopeptide repeat protein [Planctomycetaceae bacterium]